VISPLLANIYMHRYIKAFRKHGLDVQHGAVLVNYADDFVILCRRGARRALEVTRSWMARIGLALNEAKTSIRDAWRERFDFLGYSFGRMYSPKNGRRYPGAAPSLKAVRRFRERIRSRLRPNNLAPVADVVAGLNQVLRGWANYFSYGSVSKVRRNLDRYVYDRVRRFLQRRHKVQNRGTRHFPQEFVHGQLGVHALGKLPRQLFANASRDTRPRAG